MPTNYPALPKNTSSEIFWTISEYAAKKKLTPQRIYQLIGKKLKGYMKGETIVVMEKKLR